LISEGDIDFEGERIHYKWYRDGRLPKGGPTSGHQCYIEADYDEHISIDDHGYGLDHAIGLLKMELAIHRDKRKSR
jgi:hypothetical protein